MKLIKYKLSKHQKFKKSNGCVGLEIKFLIFFMDELFIKFKHVYQKTQKFKSVRTIKQI